MGCTPTSLRTTDEAVLRPADGGLEVAHSSGSDSRDGSDLSLVSEADAMAGGFRLPTPALRESAADYGPLDIDGLPDPLLQSSESLVSQEEDRNRPALPGADWKSWARSPSRQSAIASPESLAAYESMTRLQREQSLAGYSTDEPLPLWWHPAFLALLTEAEKERVAAELQREGFDNDERAVLNCLTPRRAAFVQQWASRIGADDTPGTT